jgi:Reverse transcriptase (RNA-dependent DNA polymerase)
VGKIAEKIILRQLTIHLNSIYFFHPFQSGILARHNCETDLVEVSEEIRSATEEGKATILLLLDFSKAFDTINHHLLLPKIASAETLENAVDSLSDYLFDRHQIVKIGNSTSYWKEVPAGVPQSSVGAPLLFSIFINDLPRCLQNCKHYLFDDDC